MSKKFMNKNVNKPVEGKETKSGLIDDRTREIETLKHDKVDLEEKLKKSLADYQNLTKEMKKRLDFEENMVRIKVLREIIGIADDIDVAVDHIEDEKGWREGIGLILEKFRTVIENIGAELIECKEGDRFDASIHEAIGVVNEGDDGHIAKVIQNGYRLGDVVVRPTRVIVSKINK